MPNNKGMIIMALDKAKPNEEVLNAETQKRLLKVMKSELGTDSSKMTTGDVVEFNVITRIVQDDDSGFGVEVDRVSIPKAEEKPEINITTPSPSA